MIIKNCRTYPDNEKIDIKIDNGVISTESHDSIVVDADGNMVLPSFSELHIHLDSVFILDNDIINRSGTLEEGIALWDNYKNTKLNGNEMNKRVNYAINLLIKNGVTRIRTNIDVSDPNLTALVEMLKIKARRKDVNINITAFPQHGILTDNINQELLEKALELGADNVGLAPHLEDTYEEGIKSIKIGYDLAEKYNKNIDGHIDETDDPESRFIEIVAKEKIRRKFKNSVSAGHLTAMHSYNNQYAAKVIKLISRANVNVISNPLINMHLQGRYDSYPRIRGITRIKEMLDNRVNVVIGEDCIEDPWYPIGSGDPLDALFMALHSEPLMTPYYLKYSLNMLTFNAAKAFGIRNYGYNIGDEGDFIITDSPDPIKLIQYRHKRNIVLKGNILEAGTNE